MTPELMDDPAIDAATHAHALRGLARLNRVSRSVETVWSAIHALARRRGLSRLRLLDVATGSADVPIGLFERARRAGITLEIDVCDRSAQALAIADERARAAGVALGSFPIDIVREPLPVLAQGAAYDVVLASLFLHHLTRDEAVVVIGRMAQAGRALLVNDLVRGRLNLALVGATALAVTRSRVVHVDSMLSVRAAWTPAEMVALFEEAGLRGARVTQSMICRMVAWWERPE